MGRALTAGREPKFWCPAAGYHVMRADCDAKIVRKGKIWLTSHDGRQLGSYDSLRAAQDALVRWWEQRQREGA